MESLTFQHESECIFIFYSKDRELILSSHFATMIENHVYLLPLLPGLFKYEAFSFTRDKQSQQIFVQTSIFRKYCSQIVFCWASLHKTIFTFCIAIFGLAKSYFKKLELNCHKCPPKNIKVELMFQMKVQRMILLLNIF